MSAYKSVRNVVVVAAVIGGTGYLRMPAEQRFTEDLQERKVMPPAIKSEIWSEMDQTSLAGAFGGLRSPMAALMAIKAHTHFEENEWFDLKRDYEIITALEPYNVFYWDTGAWHIGYNAASWARHHDGFSPARRRAMEMEYLEMGDAFYREGLKYNPDSEKLWYEIGSMWAHEYKRPDYERAAEAFGHVRNSPIPRYRRRYLSTIARVPGREIEAYNEAMRLLREGERQHITTTTFRTLLIVLATNPNLPEDSLRPTVDDIYANKDKAYQDLYNYRRRVEREGFYKGKLDELLRKMIVELKVPDRFNPFVTPSTRPIYKASWRAEYELELAEKAKRGKPDWMFKK